MNRLKAIFLWIFGAVKAIGLYWSILWIPLFAVVKISDKYFGNDNLFEQTVEAVNKLETGEDVDISKGSGEEPNNLKQYIP